MAPDSSKPYRVAIYAAPDPQSDWWLRGSEWLGRCAAQRSERKQPAIDDLSADQLTQLTAEPRRYGWHATLKAPFRLAPGEDMASLREGLAKIARDHQAFVLDRLEVARLDGFLALRPRHAPTALDALANDCVRRLQPLAAALDETELARRRRKPLTPEEDALMLAWGYPWVLHRFKFHFSLTGPIHGLAEEKVTQLQHAAAERFETLPPLIVDRLSLFVEPCPGADFECVEQLALGS
jgi:hypothetical protein